MSRVLRPARHIIVHFGVESSQAITCTGTDNSKQTGENTQGPPIQWARRARAQGPQASGGPERQIIFCNFEIFLLQHHKQNGAYSNGGIECLINSEFPHNTVQTGEWVDRAEIPVTTSWILCFPIAVRSSPMQCLVKPSYCVNA